MSKSKFFKLILIDAPCSSIYTYADKMHYVLSGFQSENDYSKPKYLLVVSDEKPKQGDYFIDPESPHELKYHYGKEVLRSITDRSMKIIASNSDELTEDALIPMSFIKMYVKAYNKKQNGEVVLLEMSGDTIRIEAGQIVVSPICKKCFHSIDMHRGEDFTCPERSYTKGDMLMAYEAGVVYGCVNDPLSKSKIENDFKYWLVGYSCEKPQNLTNPEYEKTI